MDDTPPRPSFWTDYGRAIFWHSDSKAGYCVAAIAFVLLGVSEVARSRLGDLASSGVSVSALGLTFVLASISLLSGLLDPTAVRTMDRLEQKHGRAYGLHGLVTAFKSSAIVGASGVISWLAVRAVAVPKLDGGGWEWLKVVLGGTSTGLTIWLVIGLVQLIGIVSTLVSGKAAFIRGGSDDSSAPD
jgi:hypothetical protein